MRSPTLGQALAAGAVVVAMPRHIVAGLHAAGIPVVRDETWTALVIASAVALAGLEALTMGYASRAHLNRYVWAMLAAISITFGPSVVADSAGLSLVELTGKATVWHFAWAMSSVAATLLIVRAAGAADDALAREQTATDRRDAALADASRRADAASRTLTDVLDGQTRAIARQDAALAELQQTVAALRSAGTAAPAIVAPALRRLPAAAAAGREDAVTRALTDGALTIQAIALATGLTRAQVRETAAWRMRQEVSA